MYEVQNARMKHKDIQEGDFKLGSKKDSYRLGNNKKGKSKIKTKDKELAQIKTSLIQERISLGF